MTDRIRFIEGFEGDTLSLVWETVPPDSSPFSDPVGRNLAFGRTPGGYGMGVVGLDQIRMESPIWTPCSMVIIGFAFRCSNFGDWGGPITLLSLRAPGDVQTITMGIDSQTLLWVASNNDASSHPVRAYSTISLDNDAWYYIEVGAFMNPPGTATGGRIVVQVNGPAGPVGESLATVIDTGFTVPTGDPDDYFGGWNQFHLGVLSGFSNEGRHMSFDDIYVRGSEDEEDPVSFLGDTKVYNLALQDDRAVQFVRLSGLKNYLMVNENTPDEDTTYNETDLGEGAEDVFEVADTPFSGEIHCLQLVVRARKTETYIWTLETLIDLAGVKEYGTPRFLGFPDYETFPPDVYGTAPGGLPWTLERLNAIGVGYRAESPLVGS